MKETESKATATPDPVKLTRRMADYLEASLALELEGMEVSVTALASRLAVSKPSVVSIVRRLTGAGLASHEQYGKIHLSDRGRTTALSIYRRRHFLSHIMRKDPSGLSLSEDLLQGESEGLFDGSIAAGLRDGLEGRDADAPLPLGLLRRGQRALVKHLLGDRVIRETGRCLGLVPGAVVRCLVPIGHEGARDLVVETEGSPRLVTGRTALSVWCESLS